MPVSARNPPAKRLGLVYTIIVNNMKFPGRKDRFLIVNYKKLQVFGSDNIKIRIEHIKVDRIISRKK